MVRHVKSVRYHPNSELAIILSKQQKKGEGGGELNAHEHVSHKQLETRRKTTAARH